MIIHSLATPLLLIVYVIPAIESLECHQSHAGMNVSSPSFCTGHLCAIVFSSDSILVQGCIVNVNMATGCFASSSSRTFCTCSTDRCNSDYFNITETENPSNLFSMEVSCPEQHEAGECSSPTCMFTNDTSRNICRHFDQPPTFYSLYPNAIFIDQSSRIETDKMNKPVVVPTQSHVTFCTQKECEEQYNIEERSRNYTRDKAVVSCYTNSQFDESSNNTCYGHACYANNFNGTITRGCFDYVYDTYWKNGRSQFLYLLEDRRAEKVTFHQFLLLEYYLCNYNYCNADNVSAKRSNSSRLLIFLNVLVIMVSVILKV